MIRGFTEVWGINRGRYSQCSCAIALLRFSVFRGVEASGLPSEASGLPFKPSGLPSEASELPFKPSGLPSEPSELPFEPSGLPFEPSELP